MRWLARLRAVFAHHPDPDCSAQVDAAFRGTMAAQLRVATAAEGASDAAAAHRARVDEVRAEIVRRTAVHERRKHHGQTSEVLSLVEELLHDTGQVRRDL